MGFVIAGSSPTPPSTAGSLCHFALGHSGVHLGNPQEQAGPLLQLF